VNKQPQSYRKPSVEDEATENDNNKKAESSQEVTKTEPEKTVAQPAPPKSRYWVSERSYGSFNRIFNFSARVKHDAVTASLKNGLLSVVVPKAKPREPRKIAIN
jgi:HSP20 family protein